MELQDKRLFDEWIALTKGKVEDPSESIRERFGAQFVFSDTKHDAFLERAADDPGLVELYRDDDAVIFAVVE